MTSSVFFVNNGKLPVASAMCRKQLDIQSGILESRNGAYQKEACRGWQMGPHRKCGVANALLHVVRVIGHDGGVNTPGKAATEDERKRTPRGGDALTSFDSGRFYAGFREI